MKTSKLTALVFVLGAITYSSKVDAQNVSNILQIGRESRTLLVQVNRQEAEAYVTRGIARRQSGDVKGAIEDYNEALRINPNYVKAYVIRGIARRQSGDVKGAIEDYNQALRINPNFAEAYVARGITRRQSGDVEGAIEDYNQALRINPNLADAYRNRGIAHRISGHMKEATTDLQKASELFQQQGKISEYQYTLDLIKRINYERSYYRFTKSI